MRWLIAMSLIGSVLVFFQNCGDSARTNGIFLENEMASSSLESECQSLECLNSAQFLWLRIREYEPYKVNYETVRQFRYFTVGGQCGSGVFANHYFQWELREAFGAQRSVAAGTAENRCEVGQFQIPIEFNPDFVQPNQRYELSLELFGVTDDFQAVTNSMPSNKGLLDVLFIAQ